MSKIIESLQRDHANFYQLLNILEAELDVFDRAERPDYDVIQAIVHYLESYSARYHHPKEDLVFAKVRQRNSDLASTIGNLEAEHEKIAAEFQKFADAVQNVLLEVEMPREAFVHAARNFIDHERRHIEMEEKQFFPAAREALTPDDWAELDDRMTDTKDPLFSEEVEEEFRALRRQIVLWEEEDQAERGKQAPRCG